jgi:hypothetical protein
MAMLPVMLVTRLALCADPFEIQVYDGTANAKARPSLEVHTNWRTSRELHVTFEPAFGLTDWWELGGYVLTALGADGRFRFEGVKLRMKFVTPPAADPHFRLGVNFELEWGNGEWGGEIRPIVAWESERWVFAFNPIVAVTAEGPVLEPAAFALIKLRQLVSLGLEYYGSWGPTMKFLPLAQQEHYLYEVINLIAVEHLELNFGVGEGFTPASAPFVVKLIVGYAL